MVVYIITCLNFMFIFIEDKGIADGITPRLYALEEGPKALGYNKFATAKS